MRLIEAYPEMEDKKKLIYANEFAEIIKDLDITVGGKPALWNDAKRTVLNELNLMPDADVALGSIHAIEEATEVEPKHGFWRTTDTYPHGMWCSECNKKFIPNMEWIGIYDIPTNYCPNCGAKMDGGTYDG